MVAILAILSVSHECIGKLNIFYKKVFRSAPPRRGDRLILVSRGPVKSQIRSVYSTDTVLIQYRYSQVQYRYSTYTDRIWDFTGPRDTKINISPRLGGAERKTFL